MPSSRAEVLALVEAAALAGDEAWMDELMDTYPELISDLLGSAMVPPDAHAIELDDQRLAELNRIWEHAHAGIVWDQVMGWLAARAQAEELRRAALDLARWQLSLWLSEPAAAPVDSRPAGYRESRPAPGGRGRNLPAHRSTGPPARRVVRWQALMSP